ncbi:MAG: hypothetical protein OEZ01_15685 [Candidatus Heimdallarchaeota archaeon]|nr:hypothetical protein [Candidatus Heimdallarchaeota archaeon]
MKTNEAIQENIQEHYIPQQQYSSHSYYTEEDRLKDRIKELENEKRDDRILKEIKDLKIELKSDINKLDSKIDSVKTDVDIKFEIFKKDISKDTELKNAQTKLWLMSTTISCTAIIGLLMTAFKFWH